MFTSFCPFFSFLLGLVELSVSGDFKLQYKKVGGNDPRSSIKPIAPNYGTGIDEPSKSEPFKQSNFEPMSLVPRGECAEWSELQIIFGLNPPLFLLSENG